MFLDDKPQGEITEAPARTLKLSEAIRKGLPLVEEDRQNWRFCALGAAFAGIHGRPMNGKEMTDFIVDAHRHNMSTAHLIAADIGFPCDLCDAVNRKHFGGMSAATIADWLEAQGY